MERLDFDETAAYVSIEAAIHFNRYFTAKQFVEGRKVLDVACGEGYGCKLLKSWGAREVIGVDISQEAIEKAKKNFSEPGITYVQHNAEKLPFADNEFDLVVSFETIEHVDDPDAFLREISRVLRYGGMAMISCPNDPYYYKQGETHNPFHKRTYTWFEFSEISQKYLGDNVDWYFGFGINGFMNYPLDWCKVPEEGRPSPKDMFGMFDVHLPQYSAIVAPDRYINHWNSNYYLGIWGKKSNVVLDNITAFPREVFIEPDNPIFADIEKWEKEFEKQRELFETLSNEADDQRKLVEQLKTENGDIKTKKKELDEKLLTVLEEKRVQTIEKQRTSSLLNLAQKENELLWKRVNHLQWLEEQARREQEKVVQEKQIEIDNYKSRMEAAENDVRIITGTKGYKFIRKCWNLIDLCKGKKKNV